MASPISQSPGNDRRCLLLQLPIPQLNFGRQTGNIPLAASCLKMSADAAGVSSVNILPESVSTYLGDAALMEQILSHAPTIVGFSVYTWNLDRSLYLASRLKSVYGPRIIFGGSEVTPDNSRIQSPDIDYYVYGDGESLFADLLKNHAMWTPGAGSSDADDWFEQSHHAYRTGLLEPQIENMVLVETQRGCPHRCAYCYYGKSRGRLSTLPVSRVIDAVSWARDQGIAEVYLLDPCLNSRKDLHELLACLARINVGRQQVRLISEIRAESVDDRLADGFAQAGFTWFEIGLQSTTPAALQTMNRPTDLKAFLQGTRRLRERGIRMGVDLIVGLPGDDPVGFSRSVRFVGDNGLSDEVQVFPLSVLPGTQFRKRSIELGLLFETHPPYTVIETPAFSRQAIAESLDEAQAYFNLSLYPMPDLDLAGCSDHFIRYAGVRTCQATVSGVPIITKALINQHVDSTILDSWAVRLAHPYQIVIGPLVGEQDWIGAVVRQLTSVNPFTPFEIVFVEPLRPPDTETILAAAQLRRPHYLDNDLAFLYPQPGNRAVLFSLLSASDRLTFQGAMQRQIRRWIHPTLPSSSQLEALDGFDGVFIPDSFDRSSVGAWQDALAPRCEMLPAITFADPAAQKRWMQLTQAGDYWLEALPDTCGP